MRDDQLLRDMEKYAYPSEVDKLRASNIASYKDLARFLLNESINIELRREICLAFSDASPMLDKRRAVTPLLAALKSRDGQLQSTAARTLGRIDSLRAVSPLIEILADRVQTTELRMDAIDSLWSIDDQRALPLFWKIIDDSTEHPNIRSRAIEEMFENPEPVEKYVRLLADPLADIRFWATYKLACSFGDISSARAELDRVVANDHTLPICWGWHVDREAMLPLETIYYHLFAGVSADENGEYYGRKTMYLISPAPEYSTLQWRFRKWSDGGVYTTDPLPEIKLRIEAEWLAKKLKAKWPEIKLNVREPRPQAYLLDWHLQIGEQHLIGALHRDQYAVVLTGDDLVYTFAEWYRGLFPDTQRLYLYQWADPHTELRPGMTAEAIEEANNRTATSAVELQAEDLTFG
jgi:hypothetical protein